jgi:hypothetical protein
LQDALTDPRLQAALCRDIHTTAQQFFQVVLQPPKIEQGPTRFQLHDEVNVAPFVRSIAHNRAENTHVSSAMHGGKSQDFAAMLGYAFIPSHD